MTQPALDFTTVYQEHRATVRTERDRRTGAMWRLLTLLKERPHTNVELAKVCLRYTGRLSDARLHYGYVIEKDHLHGGVWLYTLVRGPEQ